MSAPWFVADFETTTDPEDCRVWGWGLASLQNIGNVVIGQTIDDFIDNIYGFNRIIYFHNLRFDGIFILYWLFKNDYKFTHDRPMRNQFSTLISRMGQFYNITVRWANGKLTEFRDSLKKLPMSVADVAKAFKLAEPKGDIDYDAPRPIGHVITDQEREYIRIDVQIIAQALKIQLSQGMKRLTVGSDSLYEYRDLFNPKMFKRTFPILPLELDAEIRSAYRGGFTYASPRFSKRIINKRGYVYDVNSLYPFVMRTRLLPYGEPRFFEGAPTVDKHFPLYVMSITFTGRIKKNKIPCIQIKGSSRFVETEYVEHIIDPVTLSVTNVDWALWNEHYDLDVISYNGGYMFRASYGMFDTYIDKWMEVKETSDGGLREIAKLQLNSLYGKFATNPDVTGKYPELVDDVVRLKLSPSQMREPVYTPMGVFITSYARDVTIRAAQSNYHSFAYADTDSLHLVQDVEPDNLDIDPKRMGAWKLEYVFVKAFFNRAKQYAEITENGEKVVRIAGLPRKISGKVEFEHFLNGISYPGKLQQRSVPGGAVLVDIDFTLKP